MVAVRAVRARTQPRYAYAVFCCRHCHRRVIPAWQWHAGGPGSRLCEQCDAARKRPGRPVGCAKCGRTNVAPGYHWHVAPLYGTREATLHEFVPVTTRRASV